MYANEPWVVEAGEQLPLREKALAEKIGVTPVRAEKLKGAMDAKVLMDYLVNSTHCAFAQQPHETIRPNLARHVFFKTVHNRFIQSQTMLHVERPIGDTFFLMEICSLRSHVRHRRHELNA